MSHNKLNYAQRIRDEGCRLTPQRQIIIDTLCAMNGHTTIGELYGQVHRQAPTIDLATVYRTMNFFRDLRLVVTAEIDGETVYEVADEQPHHHLVCRVCNEVQELDDHHFHALAEHLRREHGFAPEMDHLTIFGVCRQCQTAADA